jgi:hypothetical protein
MGAIELGLIFLLAVVCERILDSGRRQRSERTTKPVSTLDRGRRGDEREKR